MPSTEANANATQLIAQFEQHQKSQLAILQALHGLLGAEVSKLKTTDNPDDEQTSEISPPSEGKKRDSSTSSVDRQPLSPGFDTSSLSIPEEWTAPWSGSLLKTRVEERRENPAFEDRCLRRGIHIDANDPAVMFIARKVLKDFENFTDARPDSATRAFYVVDSAAPVSSESKEGKCTPPTAESMVPGPLPDLSSPRSITSAFGRHIVVQAFIPSAIAAVFLSAPKDPTHDYATIYAAMRRHLSNHPRDRFHYAAHAFSKGETPRKLIHMGSISVSYFSLYNTTPAKKENPLSPAGIFGTPGPSQRYIREEKLTFSYTKQGIRTGPFLAATFGALTLYGLRDEASASQWLTNNLRHIWFKWREVLDYLDEELSIPSTVMLDENIQKQSLFDAKKLSWALRTILVFENTVDETIRILPQILSLSVNFDGSECSDWEKDIQVKNFKEFKSRVERKRKQIESLINRLTLSSYIAQTRALYNERAIAKFFRTVLLACWPISLASSIYVMHILPGDTSFISFLVLTSAVCAVSFCFAFNWHWLGKYLPRRFRSIFHAIPDDTSKPEELTLGRMA